MSAQHTPEPWNTDLSEHDHPYQDIVVRSGTRTICRVWIDDAPVHDYNAEQIANARLIAAAPDLLDALRNYVTVIATGGGGDKDLFMSAIREADNAARSAIAKATGEQV